MDIRTGFIDLSGSGLDLVYLYETQTIGSTGTTTYISHTYNKDLGSIFTLYNNLLGYSYTGTPGQGCGYKNSSGLDIGNLFVQKGSLSTTSSLNSLSFSTNQYAVLSSGTYYNSFTTATVEVYFKIPSGTTASASYQGLIVKQSQYGIFIYNNNLRVYDFTSGNTFSNTTSLADGLWHHTAYTFQPGVTNGSNLYLDGVLVPAGTNFTMSYSTPTTVPLTIGSGGFSTTTYTSAYAQQFFIGSLAFVRIWNTVKSASFISTNYNRYLNPANYTDMVGYYSFSEASGTTLNNSSSNNTYSFTLMNSPTWNTLGPTIINSSGLLTSIPTGSVGLYACKWVNNNYTGPILQLRINISGVNYIQDFCMNSSGTLIGTFVGGIGISLANWVASKGGIYGTTVIYVVQWYDQSPTSSTASGNNAYQTATNAYQPTFDTTTNSIVFTMANNTYFNISSTTFSTGNPSYSVICDIVNSATIGSIDEAILLFGSPTGTGGGNRIEEWISTSHLLNAWYGNVACEMLLTGSLPNNLVLSFTYNGSTTTRNIYYNNSTTKTVVAGGSNVLNVVQSSSLSNNTISVPSTTNGLNGSLGYLCLFNNVLSTTDRNTIENMNTNATGLLSSIPTGCVGLYACKWVNNNYRGPILQLRINITSVDYIQDFYMNSAGTVIGTLLGGTGTSLSTWITNNGGTYGTTPVYVVQWYDQSPTSYTASGNNAYQTGTTAYQPTFDTTNGVNFYKASGSSVLRLPTNMVSNGNPSYTIIYKIGDASHLSSATKQMAILLYGNHTSASYQEIDLVTSYTSPNYTFDNTVKDRGDVLYSTTTTPNNTVISNKVDSSTTTRYIYENGVLKNSQVYNVGYTTNIQNATTSDIQNTISTIINDTYFNTFQGSLKYLCFFNGVALTDTNRNIIEGI